MGCKVSFWDSGVGVRIYHDAGKAPGIGFVHGNSCCTCLYCCQLQVEKEACERLVCAEGMLMTVPCILVCADGVDWFDGEEDDLAEIATQYADLFLNGLGQ